MRVSQNTSRPFAPIGHQINLTFPLPLNANFLPSTRPAELEIHEFRNTQIHLDTVYFI